MWCVVTYDLPHYFFFFDPFPPPHLTAIGVLKSWVLPFWPPIFTSAFGLALQRLAEFWIRLFLPPFRLISNFDTGASGTAANRVRTSEVSLLTFLESMNPTRTTWIWPSRSATMSGS